jgi:U3 small nucleolar RNA-associated protein MPP10
MLWEVLDFDSATKPQPLSTEEAARSLDEVIKARAKEGLWDDVVRKEALKQSAFRPKAAELSQEKSGKSLAAEYAPRSSNHLRSV